MLTKKKDRSESFNLSRNFIKKGDNNQGRQTGGGGGVGGSQPPLNLGWGG